MHSLELKIPPPIVALLIAAAMWAVSLASPAVDTRFQIIPEERVLAGILGATNADYQSKVRRWL
jgi:protein-S-isoprenylcysteine O-methyltransferase Ste14